MKSITKSGIFICLISLILIPFTTNVGVIQYIITLGIIIYSIFALLKQQNEKFIISLFFLFLASIYILLLYNLKSKFLIYTYFFGFVLTCLYCYYFVINKQNKKINLKYKKIKIPENEIYLTCKYLTGLDFKYPANAIIIKDKNTLYIQIEHDKFKNIYKYKIKIKEIKSIVSTSKPYIIGNFKHINTKEVKPIESFKIEINLLNGKTIEFLSFNNPQNFLNIKSYKTP